MEPAKGAISSWQEKVKSILGDLGIAGETVTPTPARTIEELTNLGIIKGYSTIVAVGSQNLVNKIITVMLKEKQPKEIVLGIIPLNYDSLLAQKIGAKNINEACETLKFRRLKTVDVGYIEPDQYFITEALLESSRSMECYLTLDTLQAGLPFNKIIIKPGLQIFIYDNSSNVRPKTGILNWFRLKKETVDIGSSFFKTKKIKIHTIKHALPVKVDDEIVAKTPIICHNRSRVLKIIVSRDKIESKE
jgi:diacylglycerol kinase family enzyme